MYFVKYGKEYLHDPRTEDYTLLDLSLETEENSCGYCEFTIYPTHPMYDKLKERDADNPIEVYDDDILLFAGFIYELGKEFYLDGQVRCKGELAYLTESIVRPYSTIWDPYKNYASNTIGGFFEWLIQQHNAQVGINKQFTVGINQGSSLSSDNILYLENSSYPNTMDELSSVLLNDESIGGYIRIRHQNGIRYIDYLSEWTDTNTQILDFGVNLTDYTQTDDALGIATYIVPTGATMYDTEYSYDDGYYITADTKPDANKEYYTISDDGYYTSVTDLTEFESGVIYLEYYEMYDRSNDPLTIIDGADGRYDDPDYVKSGDMIYCESAVQKYGWIGTTYSNSDITTIEELRSLATTALKEYVSPKRTIEIKAVDMHFVNPEIKPIKVGEYVRVRSRPHNLDSYFLCTNIDLNLNNPEQSIYVLGTTFDTLTGQSNKKINELNATVNKQFDAVTALSKEAKSAALDANNIAIKAETSATEAKEAANAALLSVVEEYSVSTSSTTAPTGDWSTETPTYSSDVFVWRRVVITYGDGTTVTGDPVLMTGNSGKDGKDGTNGKDGSAGADAITLSITTSNGTVFKNSSGTTVLTAHVFKGGVEQSITDAGVCGSLGSIKWYKGTSTTAVATAKTLTVSAKDVANAVAYTCQLEG